MLKNCSESKKDLFYQIAFLLIVFTTAPNYYTQTLTAEKIYKKVSDAVVVIYAYDSHNQLSKQGSGVVINDKGYVVTNYHVLAGNDRLEVLHNKEIVPYVDIIGIDVEKDILILKIEEKKFPSIKIGDSKNLTIGQRVYAIGSPLGFENTISEGIISGLRSYEEVGKNFIQITASISPGSSGGAVVNDKGQLIGISTLTAKEGQNLNFAIPIDDVLSVEISSYSKNNAYKNFEWFSKGNDEYERGNIKADLGDYRGAIQDYSKAIEIDPNDADAYYNRGLSKAYLADYRGSIQDFTKSIEINPNDAHTYKNRGNAKYKLEDYLGAISDFSKVIELNSIDTGGYMNRGYAKYQLGDNSGACLDWSRAGELGDNTAYDIIRKYCN